MPSALSTLVVLCKRYHEGQLQVNRLAATFPETFPTDFSDCGARPPPLHLRAFPSQSDATQEINRNRDKDMAVDSEKTPAEKTPVLIAGGGPAGLAVAGDLGCRGIPCILVEKGDGSVTQPKMD